MVIKSRSKGGPRVGIRALSAELGVSVGTISRALNGEPDVNEQTRQWIVEEARRRGYGPNHAARILRRGQSDMVGFLVPSALDGDLVKAIFLPVIDGLSKSLIEGGIELAVFFEGGQRSSVSALKQFAEKGRVDALIIADTTGNDPRVDYLLALGRPFITFGRTNNPKAEYWVDPDFEAMMASAIDSLVDFGHRRIALLLPDQETNYIHILVNSYHRERNRRRMYSQTGWVMRLPATEKSGADAALALVAQDKPPTAVLVVDLRQAIGLCAKLSELGIMVGEHLTVIDLIPETVARSFNPTLTGFSVDWRQVGRSLGEVTMTALKAHYSPRRVNSPDGEQGDAEQAPKQVLVPPAFRAGQSMHRVDAGPVPDRV